MVTVLIDFNQKSLNFDLHHFVHMMLVLSSYVFFSFIQCLFYVYEVTDRQLATSS